MRQITINVMDCVMDRMVDFLRPPHSFSFHPHAATPMCEGSTQRRWIELRHGASRSDVAGRLSRHARSVRAGVTYIRVNLMMSVGAAPTSRPARATVGAA